MAGVLVTLKYAGAAATIGNGDDRTISTTITNSKGNFQFVHVQVGNNDYLHYTNNPPSSIFTDANSGTGLNDSIPNASGITPLFTLAIAANIQNQDAGIKNIGLLDVKLVRFKASKATASSVKLTWTTSENIQHGATTIYHSNDGVLYTAIATVASNPTNEYSYFHTNPLTGNNFYKISISDANIATIQSAIKNVPFVQKLSIKVYPNPVVSLINFNTDNIFQATYKIVNTQGQSIATGLINTQTTSVNVNNFPACVYTVQVYNSKNLISVETFVKQ